MIPKGSMKTRGLTAALARIEHTIQAKRLSRVFKEKNHVFTQEADDCRAIRNKAEARFRALNDEHKRVSDRMLELQDIIKENS